MADDPAFPFRRFRVLPGAAVAAVLAAALLAPQVGAETLNVTISGLAFSPASAAAQMVEGEPGFPAPHGHVKWTMADPGTEHTVTFDDPRLMSSARLAPGQVHEVVFTAAGTFPYRCTIHPAMAGTVVVRAASPAAASSEVAPPEEPAGSLQPGLVEGDGPGPEALIPLLIGLGLLAVGGLVWFILRRKRTSQPSAR